MFLFYTTIISVFFILLLSYFILYRINKNKNIFLIDWFYLSLLFFNGLVFLFIIYTTKFNINNDFLFTKIINTNINIYKVIFYFFINFLIIIFVYIGWIISKNSRFKTQNIRFFFLNKKQNYINELYYFSWFLFILSFILYRIYVNAYGGFFGYLDYSRLVRSGVFVVENPFSFLIKFGSLSLISSYLFFAFILEKGVNFRLTLIGFILSLIFSIYVLYSLAGRVGFLLYFGVFIFSFLLRNTNNILKYFIKIFIIVLTFITLLFIIDSFLKRSSNNLSLIQIFSKELSFPLANYFNVLNDCSYRIFIDLIYIPLYLLPSSFWSNYIQTSSQINTEMIKKIFPETTGEVPLDFISFGFMQANIFGVIIISFIFGFILNKLQKFIDKIHIVSLKYVMFAYIIFNIAILTVIYADPQHIISRTFPLIISLLLFIIFMRFRNVIKRS